VSGSRIHSQDSTVILRRSTIRKYVFRARGWGWEVCTSTSGGGGGSGRTPSEPNVRAASMLGVGAGGAQRQELERNSTPFFSFSLAASFASEGASPLSPIGLRGGPLSARGEASFEPLFKQGYSGDSPVALERCAVRTLPRETNQLPTSAREIKRLKGSLTIFLRMLFLRLGRSLPPSLFPSVCLDRMQPLLQST